MRGLELLFLCHLHAAISLLMSPALTTARAAKNTSLYASHFIPLAFPDLIFLLAQPGISLMVVKVAPESYTWECPALHCLTSNTSLLGGPHSFTLKNKPNATLSRGCGGHVL